MIRYLTIALTLTAVLAWLAPQAAAGEAATPQDVIAKVKEAAAYLAKTGKSGLKTFDSTESPYVWKDTYVFVYVSFLRPSSSSACLYSARSVAFSRPR